MCGERDAKTDLAVCEAATPRPWDVEGRGGINIATGRREFYIVRRNNKGDMLLSREDAEFIATAREALPYWINRAQELEASCATMRDALKRMLIGARHMSCAYKPEDPDPMWHCCDWSEVVEEIEQALSTTAGRALLERMEKLVKQNKVMRDLLNLLCGVNTLNKCATTMDGDQNG